MVTAMTTNGLVIQGAMASAQAIDPVLREYFELSTGSVDTGH